MQWTKSSGRSQRYLLVLFTFILCSILSTPAQQNPPTQSQPAQSQPSQNQAPQNQPSESKSELSKAADTKADLPSNSEAPVQAPANGPSIPPGIDPKTMTPLYETIQEDWSSLQIGASKLEPERPLVGQTEEQEKFTRSLIQLKWRPGDPIDLWVVIPKGVKNPPVVLYLYNADQDTDRFRDNYWAENAVSGGVAAVGFVSALTGHRFHDRPLKQWFVSELQESLGSTVHDVKFILDYLALRGDVDMNHVGMFGEGSGGAIAILAAAADPRIKAADALEPWGDWPDFLAKSPVVQPDPDHAQYVKPEFLNKVKPLDPVTWLPQLKVPIRIQQVRQSDGTPIECKDTIKAAAPKQAEIVRFEASKDLTTRESKGRLFDWIKHQVQEPGDSAQPSGKSSVAAGQPAQLQKESSASHQ
jgi:dienelactone hydrolase